ncbi:hypothetical protein BB560_006999 [Smittium megazygosporum]|uniref:Uncharacterized protein n=1 Tax=Smittium megazygosporum TaxID=133381 RepID=A0A2T9XZM7_9FUNG|nr:hypothetical protein BB560_006999 [Smittium megazygosporum]
MMRDSSPSLCSISPSIPESSVVSSPVIKNKKSETYNDSSNPLDQQDSNISSIQRQQELIAAEALGALKIVPTQSQAPEEDSFMSRFNNIPIVHKAFSFYDQGKKRSQLFKATAQSIESRVRSVCVPLSNYISSYSTNQPPNQQDYPPQTDASDTSSHLGNPQNFSTQYKASIAESLDRAIETRRAKRANFEIRDSYENDFSSCSSALNAFNSKPSGKTIVPEASNSIPNPSPQASSNWNYLFENARERASNFRDDAIKKFSFIFCWLQFTKKSLKNYLLQLASFIEEFEKTIALFSRDTSASLAGAFGGTSPNSELEASQKGSKYAFDSLESFILASKERLSRLSSHIIEIMKSTIDNISKYAPVVLPSATRNYVRSLLLDLPNKLSSQIIPPPFSPSYSENNSLQTKSPAHSFPFNDSNLANSIASIKFNTEKITKFADESFVLMDSIIMVFKNLKSNSEPWLTALESEHLNYVNASPQSLSVTNSMDVDSDTCHNPSTDFKFNRFNNYSQEPDASPNSRKLKLDPLKDEHYIESHSVCFSPNSKHSRFNKDDVPHKKSQFPKTQKPRVRGYSFDPLSPHQKNGFRPQSRPNSSSLRISPLNTNSAQTTGPNTASTNNLTHLPPIFSPTEVNGKPTTPVHVSHDSNNYQPPNIKLPSIVKSLLKDTNTLSHK